jgi:hypothetical protein
MCSALPFERRAFRQARAMPDKLQMGAEVPRFKLFSQVFAKFCLFSPNFSKHFFGDFERFQGVRRRKKLFSMIGGFPNFFAPARPFPDSLSVEIRTLFASNRRNFTLA